MKEHAFLLLLSIAIVFIGVSNAHPPKPPRIPPPPQFKANDKFFLDIIQENCKPEQKRCASGAFGNFHSEFSWTWNANKILESMAFAIFKSEFVQEEDRVQFVEKFFCCKEGGCLRRCNIFPTQGYQVIDDFPENANDLFDLDLRVLRKYKEPVLEYFQDVEYKKTGVYPKEIEKFFDVLYKYSGYIYSQMEEQQ